MSRRLNNLTAAIAAAALGGCIVPVYGTGGSSNQYCPPNGTCADGGGTGSTTGATTRGTSGSGSSGSGSTGTTSSSSGGTSGPASDGGCGPHGDAGTELKPCRDAADCDCPQECAPFADAGTLCQKPCATFEDCTTLQLCSAGFCLPDYCPTADQFNSCTAGNGDAGLCLLAAAQDGGTFGLCFPAGSSDGGCDPSTTAGTWLGWTSAEACLSGSLCAPVAPGGGTCVLICSPEIGHCNHGSGCNPFPGNPYTGLCLPCPVNSTSCGLSCFDPLTDDTNCGVCGNACPPGTACLAGRCTRPATMTVPRYGLAAATGPDGLVYVVGGLSSGNPLALAQTFDPRTNSWVDLPPLPTARGELGAAWGDDGQLHALGGLAGTGILTASKRNEAYDPTAQTWSAADAPLLDYRFGPATGSGADGVIYVAGGGNFPYSPTDTLFTSDTPSDGGWTQQDPMNSVREFSGGAVAADGRFYVLGGLNATGVLSSIEAYDAGANHWDGTPPPLPTPLAYLGAVAQGQLLYAIGGGTGLDGGFVGEASVYQLDLSTCGSGCSWQPVASLQTPRGAHAAALGADGRIYVMGGLVQFSNGSFAAYVGLPSVEVFDPAQPDGGWVSSVCPPGAMFETPDGSYPAGGGPGAGLAVGDLNGDQFPDAVTLTGPYFVSLINDQDGGLADTSAVTVNAGADGLQGLALADFNRDGKLDAIAVSPDNNLLFLLEGNGLGGFAAPLSYDTDGGGQAVGPMATAVADFNGDHWPDIVVADTGGSSLGVLLSQPSLFGTTFNGFGLTSFAVCANPTQVAAADLNGDGKPDLVVVCAAGIGGSLQIWLNAGNGTAFNLATNQLPVANVAGVAIADMDLDGLPDLVVASTNGFGPNSTALEIYVNQGGSNPSFLTTSSGASVPTSGPVPFTLEDVDGDGYPDVLAADGAGDLVYVFLNQVGTFFPVGSYSTPAGDIPIALATADLRRNAWTDLLVFNQNAGSLSVFLSACPP